MSTPSDWFGFLGRPTLWFGVSVFDFSSIHDQKTDQSLRARSSPFPHLQLVLLSASAGRGSCKHIIEPLNLTGQCWLEREASGSQRWVDLALYFRDLAGTPRHFQVVEGLQVKPEFSVGIEVSRQPQRSFRRDPPALVNNFPNAGGRYMKL